jgi:hypothetical protein
LMSLMTFLMISMLPIHLRPSAACHAFRGVVLHAGHERRRQKLEAVASGRCKILSHVRAGSTGEFESSRDVRPTILIVAEDSLDPAQCLQARRKLKGLPGLSSELGELTGRCVRRCDLAAAELDFGEQGQRKGQDRRGASRSCRTDNAVEHSGGRTPTPRSTPSDLGGSADHDESSPSGSMNSSDSNNDSTSARDP